MNSVIFFSNECLPFRTRGHPPLFHQKGHTITIKNLAPPKFTEDEQALIVTDLLAMKKEQIGDFFARSGLPKSGAKEQLRARIEEALGNGTVSLSQVQPPIANAVHGLPR